MSTPTQAGSTVTQRTVLVLGATGFIGCHVLAQLQATNGVTTVTSTRTPQAENLETVFFDLLHSDVLTLTKLLERLRPEAVINAAGATSGSDQHLIAVNVLAVSRLIEAMVKAVPNARLIHLGSAAEYGVIQTGQPVTEDTPCRPVSAYGISKLAATQLVTLAREDGLLEAITLRVFNPIGAGIGQNTLPGRVALALRDAIQHGQPEITTGPLGAFRDFVDVRDVATAVVAALQSPELPRGPLNVGSGLAMRSRAMVELFAQIAGFTGRIAERDAGSPRSSDVNWQQADLSQIKDGLGWTPKMTLRDSLEALWQSVAPTALRHTPIEVANV